MPIQLECRFGHRFATSAKPGGTTGCPVCRRAGRRTSVRVPVGAAAAIGREGQGADVGGELGRLIAAWAAEAPAVTDWRRTPAEPSEYTCDDCGGPLLWHSAHTALACLACPASVVSPGALERAAAHAASLERRRARASGAELAVIDPDAEARARAARVRLRGQREALGHVVRELEAVTDPGAHIRAQYKRLGFDIGAALRGYLPEIADAADEATIASIAAELEQLRTTPEYLELAREAEQVQQQREQQQYRAELERQRTDAEAAEARQLAELKRQQAAEARRQLPAQQRRQLPAGRTAAQPMPTGNLAEGIAYLLAPMVKRQQQKERLRALNGECGWCKNPAERVYGISGGVMDNYGNPAPHPRLPQARACHKHFETADQWIQGQRGQWDALYWELTA